MKKLLKTLALLAFIVFSLNCQARKNTHSGIPKWIVSKTKGTKVARINADFSAILTDDRVQFIGFIGSDYQNLKVSFQAGQYTIQCFWNICCKGKPLSFQGNNQYNSQQRVREANLWD